MLVGGGFAVHVKSIAVRNFRLLSEVDLSLEASEPDAESPEVTTVVVGRNNSGKTSFTEIFRRLDKPNKFELEDFSTSAYNAFCDAHTAYLDAPDDQDKIRDALPAIEVRITIGYDPEQPNYGPLADFIVDLDESADEALLVARYELGKGRIDELFADLDTVATDDHLKGELLAELRPRVNKLFGRTLQAEDPNDDSNVRDLPWSHFEELLTISFISAQRGLDDVTDREVDVLARLVEKLFEAASAPAAPDEQREVVGKLREAVEGTEAELDEAFKKHMRALLPTLEDFGYPGLDGPPIGPEVTLEVEKLLERSTKMRYAGYLGVALPESYSGLGTRNLLAILLQLLVFRRSFVARGEAPGLHLVFVEEPEAHLHPQMQEVFIRKLNLLTKATNQSPAWPAQFVVSTHSSHIANQAPFMSIRYFIATPESSTPLVRTTTVKDLSVAEGLDRDFLHQYLTLTRCDLFFADHAILIEGTSERLILPAMISSVEGLSSRYFTLLEVGGAYAHIFFPLLAFLELPALVITDIDSVGEDRKKCSVADGTATSNATIKDWFDPKVTVGSLLGAGEDDKVREPLRIAYQVPEEEGGPCGRTFEDAFILANRQRFGIQGEGAAAAAEAAEVARESTKSEFALRHAIRERDWQVPRYIGEGLQWLVERGPVPETPGQTVVTQ
jgi:predicted ATP-dependent endonuclease of OLD family